MRFVDAEIFKNVGRIVDGPALRVLLNGIRHFGWRIAPRIIGDAAIASREISDLELPGSVISGEFVNEQDRAPSTCLLVIQLYAVVCRQIGHFLRLSVTILTLRGSHSRRRSEQCRIIYPGSPRTCKKSSKWENC